MHMLCANFDNVELVCQGDSWVRKHDRSSLRVLGSVGEPINPRAWQWLFEVRALPLERAVATHSASEGRDCLERENCCPIPLIPR